jgi:hypothetical protein
MNAMDWLLVSYATGFIVMLGIQGYVTLFKPATVAQVGLAKGAIWFANVVSSVFWPLVLGIFLVERLSKNRG